MMRRAISRHVLRSALLIVVLACFSLTRVVAQTRGTVFFKKFQLFFELLDQSGGLSAEFTANDGDLCSVNGISCRNGDVTAMYDHFPPHARELTRCCVCSIITSVLNSRSSRVPTPCSLECASHLADVRSVFNSARLKT